MTRDRRLWIPRRTVLRGLLATGALGVTSQFWTSCANSTPTPPGEASDETITIGFIYVGPKDDYGYNQAHAQAAASMAAQSPWVRIVEEASIPETTAVQESMRNMIEVDGASIIFPTSWGYFDPHSLQLAKEFPEVQFFHPNHPLDPSHPANVGSYFSSLIEPAYLTGIVAGLSTKTGKLGYVVPKPIPVVIQEVNSFALGARSVNPEVIVQTVVTGDWALPVKEAEATNSLIDQNADVIITRVDSPKVVITTAAQRGVYSCGYHVAQNEIAADSYLTGVEWNWEQIYRQYAQLAQAGQTLMNGGIPKALAGGLKEEFARISPYGAAVSTAAQAAADSAKQEIIAGTRTVFQGEIQDNRGNVIIPAGESWVAGDDRLNSMDWWVAGVVAS